MADLQVPPGMGIPLVDLATGKLPTSTMTAITEDVQGSSDLPDLATFYENRKAVQ